MNNIKHITEYTTQITTNYTTQITTNQNKSQQITTNHCPTNIKRNMAAFFQCICHVPIITGFTQMTECLKKRRDGIQGYAIGKQDGMNGM